MNNRVRSASMRASDLVFGAKDVLGRLKGGLMNPTKAELGKIYSFEMTLSDGTPRPLSFYKGRPFLIVNTASLCGYTPQYAGLEDLYKKFRDQGLAVLAFPANEFGTQEPGTNQEISQFCRTKYSISFDLFAKIVVKGDGMHPLYAFLTRESGHAGEIPWNFTKFLVDRSGGVVARFGPQVDPSSKEIVAAVEKTVS
ncbi:MAG: glutathione peroxidase [Elusimicrobiota bacterium]